MLAFGVQGSLQAQWHAPFLGQIKVWLWTGKEVAWPPSGRGQSLEESTWVLFTSDGWVEMEVEGLARPDFKMFIWPFLQFEMPEELLERSKALFMFHIIDFFHSSLKLCAFHVQNLHTVFKGVSLCFWMTFLCVLWCSSLVPSSPFCPECRIAAKRTTLLNHLDFFG